MLNRLRRRLEVLFREPNISSHQSASEYSEHHSLYPEPFCSLTMAFTKAKPHAPLPTTDILSWIFDKPSYEVNKPVLIDAAKPSRSISNSQAHIMVRKLIAGLRHFGVQPGDCVCIHSFNDVEYILLALAIIGAGGVLTGTNPAYTSMELTHHLKVTATNFVISEPELLSPMFQATKSLGIPQSRILVFHPFPDQECPPNMTSYLSLFNHGESDWKHFTTSTQSKTTTACRFTSSGTSGLPKACINTHFNSVAQHELNYSPTYWKKPYSPRHLWPLPLFHVAIGPRAIFSALKSGEDAYLMRRFELETYVRNIERYAITELYVVPPIVIALVMSPLVQSGEVNLNSVKAGAIGAAPLTKEMQARCRAYLSDDAKFCQAWGMTEANCIIASFDYPEDDDTGSVGYLRPGIEGKLVDDEGRDISGVDVVGEMCVRGPLIIPGYFNADGTVNRKDWDDDGWYHTGDMMYEDGKSRKLYIVDRKKELIKVRGFQVAPPEVEGVILAMEGVVDCAVIGVKAAEGEGEVPRAYVVRRPGYTPLVTEEEVKAKVAKSLASFKQLMGGVRFVESIPKTASGKILKRILRDEAKMEEQGRMAGPKL